MRNSHRVFRRWWWLGAITCLLPIVFPLPGSADDGAAPDGEAASDELLVSDAEREALAVHFGIPTEAVDRAVPAIEWHRQFNAFAVGIDGYAASQLEFDSAGAPTLVVRSTPDAFDAVVDEAVASSEDLSDLSFRLDPTAYDRADVQVIAEQLRAVLTAAFGEGQFGLVTSSLHGEFTASGPGEPAIEEVVPRDLLDEIDRLGLRFAYQATSDSPYGEQAAFSVGGQRIFAASGNDCTSGFGVTSPEIGNSYTALLTAGHCDNTGNTVDASGVTPADLETAFGEVVTCIEAAGVPVNASTFKQPTDDEVVVELELGAADSAAEIEQSCMAQHYHEPAMRFAAAHAPSVDEWLDFDHAMRECLIAAGVADDPGASDTDFSSAAMSSDVESWFGCRRLISP